MHVVYQIMYQEATYIYQHKLLCDEIQKNYRANFKLCMPHISMDITKLGVLAIGSKNSLIVTETIFM